MGGCINFGLSLFDYVFEEDPPAPIALREMVVSFALW